MGVQLTLDQVRVDLLIQEEMTAASDVDLRLGRERVLYALEHGWLEFFENGATRGHRYVLTAEGRRHYGVANGDQAD